MYKSLNDILPYIQSRTKDVSAEEIFFQIQLSAQENIRSLALLRNIAEFRDIQSNQDLLLVSPADPIVGVKYKFGRIVRMYVYEKNPNYEIPARFYRHMNFNDYIVQFGDNEPVKIDGSALINVTEDFYRNYKYFVSGLPNPRKTKKSVMYVAYTQLDKTQPQYGELVYFASPQTLVDAERIAGRKMMDGDIVRPNDFIDWGNQENKLLVEFCYTITKSSTSIPERLFEDYAELIGLGALTRLADAHLLDRKADVKEEFMKELTGARSRIEGGITAFIPSPVGGLVGDTRTIGYGNGL